MIAEGTQLGPYKILSPLGAGGMGEVYRAKDLRLGREVAIKVLPEAMARDSEALSRFEREARTLAALSHPNILIIYDFGTDKDITFVVMELLEGETLKSYIARAPLTPARIVEISIAIMEGLAAAHSKGIIHRDIKPDNIFITTDGSIKVLDFGLARVETSIFSQDEQSSLSTIPTRGATTEPGVVVGTVPYMSPEQLQGETADTRSDIFSFGCLLYEMVTGQKLFFRNTAAETIAAIMRDELPKSVNLSKRSSPELEIITRRCLEKEPEKRYQSARELLEVFKNIQSGAATKKSSMPALRSRKVLWSAAALLLIAIAASLFLFTGRSQRINTLAVLPLANASADPNTEYLSDGITESLINSLSQLPDLKVMSRSSVFRYKGRDIDPLVIGRELKVQALLTGRVVQRGDSLSISVELVDSRDSSQIWGEQYTRRLSDIFTLQEEISKDISEKLLLKVTGEEQKRMAKRYTYSPEAYQIYLKGRYHWNKRTKEDLKKSIEYYKQVTDIDPNYALAYSGLADSYNILSLYSGFPPKEAFPRARAAAMRALEIDDTLAEAHASLGLVRWQYDWDWAGAEKEFRRAIELKPNYATAHDWYGMYKMMQGRFDEAEAEFQLARELDPLSLIINVHAAWPAFLSRRYDTAIEQFRKTMDIDANFWPAHVWLGRSYEQKQMYTEAIAEIQKGRKSNDTLWILAILGHAYAGAGKKEEALKTLNDLQELSKQTYISPYYIAIIHAGLGEKDEAMKWLEKTYEDRAEWMVWLKVDPALDNLRSDPRFIDLMKRVGLEK